MRAPTWWDTDYAVELLLLFLAAPILYFPQRFPSLFLFIALGLLAGTWLWRRLRLGHWIAPTPAAYPIFFLFLVMLPIAVWAAPEALRETYSLPRVYLLIWNFCLFWTIFTHSCASPRRLMTSLLLMIGGGALVGLIALPATNWMQKLPVLSELVAALPNLGQQSGLGGLGFHPNTIAGILLYVLFFLIAWCIKSLTASPLSNAATNVISQWIRVALLYVFTGFIGIVFLLTQSRSGYLALAVGVITLFFFYIPRVGKVFMVCILAATLVVPFLGPTTIGMLAGEERAQLVGGLGTLGFREDIWQRAGQAISDFPFTGIGLGTFTEIVWLYYPPLGSNIARIDHAHNFYLQTALDTGIPGLIAVVVLLLIVTVKLFQLLYTQVEINTPPFVFPPKQIALAAWSTLCAQLFFFQLDAISLGNRANFMFWMFLAIVLAFVHSRPAISPHSAEITYQEAEPEHSASPQI